MAEAFIVFVFKVSKTNWLCTMRAFFQLISEKNSMLLQLESVLPFYSYEYECASFYLSTLILSSYS
jgi:hypothetical protein